MDFNGIFRRQCSIVEEAKSIGFIAFGVMTRWPDDSDATTALTAQYALNDLE